MPDPVLIINPREDNPRRKRKRKSSRRKSRRSRARRTNPRRGYSRRRFRRRNPRSMSLGLGDSLKPMAIVRNVLMPAGIGGAGAVALDVALAYLPVPDMLKTGVPNILTKLVVALGLGFIAGKVVGRDKGRLITLGAVTVMGAQFIRDQAKNFLPDVKGLGGYNDYVDYRLTQDRNGMGAYMASHAGTPLGFISPAPVLQNGSGGMNGLGAYMSPDLVPGGAALGDYNDGM